MVKEEKQKNTNNSKKNNTNKEKNTTSIKKVSSSKYNATKKSSNVKSGTIKNTNPNSKNTKQSNTKINSKPKELNKNLNSSKNKTVTKSETKEKNSKKLNTKNENKPQEFNKTLNPELNNNKIKKEDIKASDIQKTNSIDSEEKKTVKSEINSNKPKKKKKLRLKRWVWLVLILICLVGLSVALLNIFVWNKDNKAIDNIVNDITDQTEITEVTDEGETVNPPENKEDPYWSYINLPLINVDFSELLKTNDQTVGFIKVNGTNINYPVVQGSDNSYYLNHTFDKSSNGGGWVFMDYRNNINNLDQNSIIYAHGRQNTTMFGSLKNIIKNNWYANTSNHVVNLSTAKENTLWQVFSVYTIPTETYYITTNFGSKDSHQKFLDTILGRSVYDFKTNVNTDDKVLTLSTCLNDEVKVVLHAKLIKKQVR